MSIDLLLKPSCGGCGSTTDLYGSNSKHMTLCLTCVKTMAENKAKCFDCGATVTRFIREYSVRASTGNGKNYFIGRFVSDLPAFSKKKSAENKWCLMDYRAARCFKLHCGKMCDFQFHHNCGQMPLPLPLWTRWQQQYCGRNTCRGPQFKTMRDDDDEDEDNEEGGGLSKSGKELKKLLGRTSDLNESDDEDDDDDDDDDDVDDDAGVPPVIAIKQKDATEEEPADNSPLKPAATGTARGTSKPSKGKRKLNEDTKASNGAPPKRVKTENEPKSSVKDENEPASKSNAPPKGVPPAPSSKVGSSSIASGSVSEEEIRAVLMQKAPMTTQELVANFKTRLKSREDKNAFADIVKRISKIQKTYTNYLILR